MLGVRDGSTLNFAKRGKTEGLGVTNQTGAGARGLNLRAAVNTGGVRRAAGRARRRTSLARRRNRTAQGFRDSAEAAAAFDGVQVVGVREADFVERRERTPGVELLVRAKTNRVLGKSDADKLFDKVRPAGGKRIVEVKRLSARVKASKQEAVRSARQATVALRYLKVELSAKRKAPVTVVHIREENPPTERLEGFLSTTPPVENDAERPGTAWRIEDYFRVLKSGCRGTRGPDGPAMVNAWRVRLGRELSDRRHLFSDVELKVLTLFAATQGRAEKPRRGRLPGRRRGRSPQTRPAKLGTDVVRLPPTCRNGPSPGTPG